MGTVADHSRVILPLLGEYIDSGYRTPKDRIIYSLRSNARYQLILIACAAGGGIYVFLQNGFAGGSIKSLVMAWVYTPGALVLMLTRQQIGLLLGLDHGNILDGSWLGRCTPKTLPQR